MRISDWSSDVCFSDLITGGGFASRHDSDGDILYGMEVCVNPEFRRMRIGQRFYRKRQKLCQDFELKGIAFAGRMPGYSRRRKEFPDPHAYLEAVLERSEEHTSELQSIMRISKDI